MTFNEYSLQVALTAKYPNNIDSLDGLNYVTIAIGGEVGEYQNEYKKHLRTTSTQHPVGERRERMLLELGDVLWYLARAAHELNSNLDEVAKWNIEKLKARYEREA